MKHRWASVHYLYSVRRLTSKSLKSRDVTRYNFRVSWSLWYLTVVLAAVLPLYFVSLGKEAQINMEKKYHMELVLTHRLYIETRAAFTNMVYFNHSLNKSSNAQYKVGWDYLSIPKRHGCHNFRRHTMIRYIPDKETERWISLYMLLFVAIYVKHRSRVSCRKGPICHA